MATTRWLPLIAGVSLCMLNQTSWANPAGTSAGARDHLELVRMWKLVEALDIDEEQAARVFPAFSRHRAAQLALQDKRTGQLRALRQLLAGEDTDDDDLLEAIGKVRRVEDEERQLEKAFQDQLDGLLTARQQVRLLLFEGTFRTDLRDIVRRMRVGEGPPGMGPEGARRRRGASSD